MDAHAEARWGDGLNGNKRVINLEVRGDWGKRVTLRAEVIGVQFSSDREKVVDELTERLMTALVDLPVVSVRLGRVRVK